MATGFSSVPMPEIVIRTVSSAASVTSPAARRRYTKARLVPLKREVGENHPFIVGADGVQRYFTVMAECALASRLRAGAK